MKNIAASSNNMGLHWTAATTQPHGYRSAVAYDATRHTWIAIGPNGTDVSTDDGRHWQPLKPNPQAATPPTPTNTGTPFPSPSSSVPMAASAGSTQTHFPI